MSILCRARVALPFAGQGGSSQWGKFSTRSRQCRHRQGESRDDTAKLRVAIVGSGPAGFYTAKKLMSEVRNASVDMYEHLPVPFGLVRFGVAPDHPEVKNCQDSFTELAQDARFEFIGNVNVGFDIPLSLLTKHHDAIIFAYGASKDRELGLDGEREVKNIYSARAFVGWYNGLPQYRNLNPDLTTGEDAIIIGQGNVALDVARILLTDVDALKKTDISSWALERLAESRIRNIRIVGRRGPVQAAFTIKEIRELIRLPNARLRPISPDLFPPNLSALPRPQKRILELLQKGSSSGLDSLKKFSLDFLLSPRSITFRLASSGVSHTLSEKILTGIDCVHNTLADHYSPSSALLPTPTDAPQTHIPASTLFRSIGYKSEPIPGFGDLGIPFDEQRGVIQNDGVGRVSGNPAQESPVHMPGLYCAGWVKRGPTGVIASTMSDSFATAEAVAADWTGRRPFLESSGKGWPGVEEDAKRMGVDFRPVTWKEWEIIDRAEKARGAQQGRIRDKLGRVEEMLALIEAAEREQ